ncbi:MAG: rhodanese-like domain-containing protein [Desulfamplus sp.]|nr:rhodanese-like domain-containing protein [Desulfamplus sp.]
MSGEQLSKSNSDELRLNSDEVERKKYHLSIIRAAVAELGSVRHHKLILESFLMSAQGGTGALGGFAAITGKLPKNDLTDNGHALMGTTKNESPIVTANSRDFHIKSSRAPEDAYIITRGVENITSEQIELLIKEACEYISNQEQPVPFFITQGSALIKNRPLPLADRFVLILVCPIEDQRLVFLGLLPAMHGRDYDSEDRQLLTSLSSLFQISLNCALFSTRVELLNSELQKRNIELDRQVFYLNALRELTMEASEAVDVNMVLTVFLPTLLGRFSRHQGLVAIHDRATETIWLRSMGLDQTMSNGDRRSFVDRLLFLCLAGVKNKHIQPLQVEPVIEFEPILSMLDGFVPESAFLFLIKEQMYGALLLGSPLEERKFSEQERELLFAFVSQSVLHIKSADSFGTIVALNDNLAQQNQALRRTIDELTRAERRISVLEAAAIRITKIVNRNAERLMQVRLLDFVLLVGISLVLGAIFNLQNPRGIPLMPLPRPDIVKSISSQEAQKLLSSENALLIDARPRELYELGHATNAISVPSSLFDATYAMRFSTEDPERVIIIYGRSFSRLYDEAVARDFFNQDHEKIFLIKDDLELIFKLKADITRSSSETTGLIEGEK